MSKKKTVLVVGASSFIGSNLIEFLKDDYRMVGTYFSTMISIPGVLLLPCDVLKKEELQSIMFALKPDITIYCAGVSSIEVSSKNEDYADALNTMGLFNVVDVCQRYKSHLCFISSGYVFSGEDKEYRETDIPDPSTFYGKTKASAEFYVQKTSLNYSIFRCCQMYGRGISPSQLTWFEFMQRALINKQPFTCDSMVNVGFLDVNYFAMVLKMCFENDVRNRLFQFSSVDVMNHYDFMKEYCDVNNISVITAGKGRWPFPIIQSSTFSYSGGGINFKLSAKNIEGYLKISLPTIRESLEYSKRKFNGQGSSQNSSKSKVEINYI